MAAITDLAAASSVASGDQLVVNQSGTDRRADVANFLYYSDLVVPLKTSGTNTLRWAAMAAGANAMLTLHGTRSSGLTVNDTIRLNFAMSNAGNSPTTYAIIEAGVDAFNGGGRLVFYTGAAGGSATERGRIDATGKWGIGTLVGSGNRAVYSDSSGYLTNTSSDKRLKKSISAIDPAEALAIVAALRPVRFNWRDAKALGEQREMGLVAQEVQTIAPEVVGENADGMLSLDYPKLVAVLAGAVQALAARVARLEAEAKHNDE